MRVIAIITDADVVQRILKHLGLWAPRQIERAPPVAEAGIEPVLPADNVLSDHPVPDSAVVAHVGSSSQIELPIVSFRH